MAKKTTPRKISQKKALELAIKVLIDWRRRHYAMGEEAFKKGVDFTFAEDGHRHYTEYTQAIQQLEDLIEILEDPGVTISEEGDYSAYPLFAGANVVATVATGEEE